MTPLEKWEHIINDVEKTKVPVEFIKKLVVRLSQRRQRTINIQMLVRQGLEPDEIEEVITRKLSEWDDELVSYEVVLDIENIANIVQPETDKLLKGL
jgi:hypothetical protein